MKSRLAIMLSAALLLQANTEGTEQATAPAPSVADRGAMVSLAPLRLELAGAETSAILRVSNPSNRAVGVQVRIFRWSQTNGAETYAASNDVMISPSIMQIAPGQTQIFRVSRRDAPSAGEKRFRIAVDQLPDPGLEAAGEAQARIRFTIPLLIDRDKAAPAQPQWAIDAGGLKLANAGGQTIRVAGIELTDATGTKVDAPLSGLRYAHGGSTITWPLGGICPAGPVQVTANIDGTSVNAQASSSCN